MEMAVNSSRILRLIIAAAVGIVLGVIASKLLFVGSALTLVPWGIAALIIGYFSAGRGEAVLNGVVYGFLLCFVFLVSGYTGSEPITSPMPFFALLGLFGAVRRAVLFYWISCVNEAAEEVDALSLMGRPNEHSARRGSPTSL